MKNTLKVSKVKTVFLFSYFPESSSQFASDFGGELNTTDSPSRSVFRMLRQRFREKKEYKRKLHNYSSPQRLQHEQVDAEGKLSEEKITKRRMIAIAKLVRWFLD